MTAVLAFIVRIAAYVGARIREPSTWAGISLLAGLFHINLPPETSGLVQQLVDAAADIVSNVTSIIGAVGALYAIFVPDRSAALAQSVSALPRR